MASIIGGLPALVEDPGAAFSMEVVLVALVVGRTFKTVLLGEVTLVVTSLVAGFSAPVGGPVEVACTDAGLLVEFSEVFFCTLTVDDELFEAEEDWFFSAAGSGVEGLLRLGDLV